MSPVQKVDQSLIELLAFAEKEKKEESSSNFTQHLIWISCIQHILTASSKGDQK